MVVAASVNEAYNVAKIAFAAEFPESELLYFRVQPTYGDVTWNGERKSDQMESGEVVKTLPEIVRWLKDYNLPEIFEALKANVKIKRHEAFLQDCIDHFTPTHESEVTLRNG